MFDVRKLMAVARKFATFHFGHLPDREDLICDVQSTAWENAEKDDGQHSLKSYVWFAVRDVRNRRHFRELIRSVDCPRPVRGRESRPKRAPEFNVADLFHDESPGRIAPFVIDFGAWFASLTERQQTVAGLLAMGYTTQEVAGLMRCTEGNVSQYRERLRKSWYRFIADRK